MRPHENSIVPFDVEASRSAWDQAAELWSDFVESGLDYYRIDFHGPALLNACGLVEGLRVLDLGCGQGYFTRLLAESGARAIGVDLSKKLVVRAIEHEARLGLGSEFYALDATEVTSLWPPDHFDLATACVSLQDMADADASARATARVLKDGGRFVFSIPHPVTCSPDREWAHDDSGMKGALKIDRYFDSGPRLLRWAMPRLKQPWETPYWHRTIEQWSDILLKAGFLIRRLHEPRPSVDALRRLPPLEDSLRLPSFLIFDAIKSPGSTAPTP